MGHIIEILSEVLTFASNSLRALRPTVISRKISFGSQSEKGLKNREILMTILHTAQVQGHDPAEFLRKAMDILAESNPAGIAKLLFSEQKSKKVA